MIPPGSDRAADALGRRPVGGGGRRVCHGAAATAASGPGGAGRERRVRQVALERGRLDAVSAGLLFMAGMRRSEASALRWADVVAAADGDGIQASDEDDPGG